MIIAFTVENYKPFLESTTIDFTAGKTFGLPGNLLRLPNGQRFVKSMALYGPNASGKTTILDGLYALQSFVLFSSQDQKPTSPVPLFEPFTLGRQSLKQPVRIALTIQLGGDTYTLDVSATAERVWSESLKVQRTMNQPIRKAPARTLIERAWDPKRKRYIATLHDDVGTELTRDAAKEQTTPNRLMIGKLASLNSDTARRVIEWFDKDLEFYDLHRNQRREEEMLTAAARLFKDNGAFAALIGRLLKDADTGIRELGVVDEDFVVPVLSEQEKKLEFKKRIQPTLSFRHVTKDGSEIAFRSRQESSGTLRFVALLAALLQPTDRPRLVCIDEISASLHPDLVRRLMRIVHTREYNRLGTQLLFTTHDTTLLDPRDRLRRDQITICSKDRFGRSTARRLDSFQDSARSDANLQRQYLDGRFGGLPRFGPTLEDVSVDDEPLEVTS